ncbi:hypothetical protein SAMN05444156_2971 [Verrucomicrobium sp. GAS474]|nr:hypothetical protein SAMN05444156_2971 [Verrucomicrobium sp. GAS474]
MGMETFPELRDEIERRYRLAVEVNGMRLYVLRDE